MEGRIAERVREQWPSAGNNDAGGARKIPLSGGAQVAAGERRRFWIRRELRDGSFEKRLNYAIH